MKFTIALLAILSATAVQAAPMKTCQDQAACLDFTITEVEGNDCSGDCDFVVCMTVNQSKTGCDKSGSISHTCEKPSSGCSTDDGFFGLDTVASIGDGYTSCQTVSADDTAEFLMKDGNGVCATGSTENAECMALEDKYETGGSCTGNTDKECIWLVATPTECSGSTTNTDGDTGTDDRNGSISTSSENSGNTDDSSYLCT
jgi:hypothetical protein